jgi:hypothetical protein
MAAVSRARSGWVARCAGAFVVDAVCPLGFDSAVVAPDDAVLVMVVPRAGGTAALAAWVPAAAGSAMTPRANSGPSTRASPWRACPIRRRLMALAAEFRRFTASRTRTRASSPNNPL